MKKFSVIKTMLLASMIAATSCSDSTATFEESVGAKNETVSSYKVTENEAKQILSDFLDVMGSPSTYGSPSRKRQIKDVEAIRLDNVGATTYASSAESEQFDIDTLMYIVNFDDEQGYALVAADKRTDPIYAIIDEGSLSADELQDVDNPGFAMFLENAVHKELADIKENQGQTTLSTYSRPSQSYFVDRVWPKLYVNGYYLNNIFNTEQGSLYTDLGMDEGSNSTQNFQYKQRISTIGRN